MMNSELEKIVKWARTINPLVQTIDIPFNLSKGKVHGVWCLQAQRNCFHIADHVTRASFVPVIFWEDYEE